ncbi:MAG: AAA family ATPase [Bacteroidales bacterium]|nr:AAA family ATPase [Bacteroidales bacterium]
MLKDHIASKLRNRLKLAISPSQERLVKLLAEFTTDNSEDAIMIVGGYAGTGKTTAIGAYVAMLDELRLKSVLLAPTGRAAKVLSSFAGKRALTIHKKIYRQRSSKDGFGKFVLDKNLHTHTIFIVDEASMISNQKLEGSIFGSGYLLDDLIEYVYNGKGCKLIFIGDVTQLPPVHLDLSPALDNSSLEKYSETIYNETLFEVVRQKETSGILHNATLVRHRIDDLKFDLPIFNLDDFDDIIRIGGEDLIETISTCHDKLGIEETIIINRSNKRANKYNQGIRNSILYREEELVTGDLLMVVKNNYYWLQKEEEIDFIANGDIIEVIRIHKYYDMYGYRFVDCTVRLIDYDIETDVKIMLDVLYEDAAALSSEKNRDLFYTILEDYGNLKTKKAQYERVRNNEFFNAIQVKYAYAVTCHKSQGGQWKAVFIDQGYITKESIDKEYLRWLYTALTRATEKVYLVNFPDFLFA